MTSAEEMAILGASGLVSFCAGMVVADRKSAYPVLTNPVGWWLALRSIVRSPWFFTALPPGFSHLYHWLRGRALRAEARRILAARRQPGTGPYR